MGEDIGPRSKPDWQGLERETSRTELDVSGLATPDCLLSANFPGYAIKTTFAGVNHHHNDANDTRMDFFLDLLYQLHMTASSVRQMGVMCHRDQPASRTNLFEAIARSRFHYCHWQATLIAMGHARCVESDFLSIPDMESSGG